MESTGDFQDLENHYEDLLSRTNQSLGLISDGELELTEATLNSVRFELGPLKKEIRETKEVMKEWKDLIHKAKGISGFLDTLPSTLNQISSEMSSHSRLESFMVNKENKNTKSQVRISSNFMVEMQISHF